jgi:hypothetical protein
MRPEKSKDMHNGGNLARNKGKKTSALCRDGGPCYRKKGTKEKTLLGGALIGKGVT